MHILLVAFLCLNISLVQSAKLFGFHSGRGPTGRTGQTGGAGPTGRTGSMGIPGSPGPQGAPGLSGATGATGSSGPNGSPGFRGATGITGATGPGSPGSTGAAGTTGTTGALGGTGATGSAQNIGPLGPQGALGSTGASGVNGATGPTGQGFTGPAGIAGSVGNSGITGITGPTGGMATADTYSQTFVWNFTANFSDGSPISLDRPTLEGHLVGHMLSLQGSVIVFGSINSPVFLNLYVQVQNSPEYTPLVNPNLVGFGTIQEPYFALASDPISFVSGGLYPVSVSSTGLIHIQGRIFFLDSSIQPMIVQWVITYSVVGL